MTPLHIYWAIALVLYVQTVWFTARAASSYADRDIPRTWRNATFCAISFIAFVVWT